MKLVHNMISGDIPTLIHLVASCEFLKDSTKDAVIQEFENISEELNKTEKDGVLDVVGLDKKIFSITEDTDHQMLDNLLFTTLPKISDIELETLSIEESMDVPSEKKIDDKLPIFFIFNGGNNFLSRAIMLFTRADFSHVSISLKGMSEIISFATTAQNYGLVVENWFDFCHIRNPKNIAVHFIDVPMREYEKIKKTIEYHKAHNDEYYYSFKKLFTAPFRSLLKPGEEKNGFICSEFVHYLCNGTSIVDSIPDKKEWFITPNDFRNKILKVSNVIYSGGVEDFNPKIVTNVFKMYSEDVMKKKDQLDKKIENSFKKEVSDEAKVQLSKFKLTLNK